MAQNGIPKPKTENAWQVWQVISIVISIHLYISAFYLVEVSKKAAIPAM
jgi:hypothetical protein